MKFFRLVCLVFTVSLLQACSFFFGSSSDSTETGGIDSSTPILPVAYTSAPTFIMRGEMVLGLQTQSFTPCGSNKQYWVELTKEDYKQASGVAKQPSQQMYAELIGYIQAPSEVGLDADFIGKFVVTKINMLTTENIQRCDNSFRPTVAFGNEPYWDISFSRGEFHYTSTQQSSPESFPVIQTDLSADKRTYISEEAVLTLEDKLCDDTMSDSLYGWTAQLSAENIIADKNKVKGCATLANIDSTQDWVGSYLAASTTNLGFSISVELEPDHTATTTYIYGNDEPNTREIGFWQQQSESQVQVVMTRYQGQRLISERVFTLEGDQISTQKERVNGQEYPIANGGLVLFKQ